MRTCEPPIDTWTISRKVVSLANSPLLFAVATGAEAHVPTQWLSRAAEMSGVSSALATHNIRQKNVEYRIVNFIGVPSISARCYFLHEGRRTWSLFTLFSLHEFD